MNLRISQNQIRFRITQAEAALLTRNGSLAFSLSLGAHRVAYSLALAELEQALVLDVQKDAWRLLVDYRDFRRFIATLPSREGIKQTITTDGGLIELLLEADVRRK